MNEEPTKRYRVEDGKFDPRVILNGDGEQCFAIGYSANSDLYLILDGSGWILENDNHANYFEYYNVDEGFRGCRVRIEAELEE